MIVIFSHGKESGPWGSKIKTLAKIAQDQNHDIESIDYSDLSDPDLRVKRLLDAVSQRSSDICLVGSSMGGYVSLVASEHVNIKSLFLLAPALYMHGYDTQNFNTSCQHIEIVHGWSDDIIPISHSIKFAKESNCSLHAISGDHRLNSSITMVSNLFKQFLIAQ